MNFFAHVKFNGPMTDNFNFISVPNAAISLFVMHTSSDFYELVNAMSKGKSVNFDCIDNPTYEDYIKAGETVGCGNKVGALIIFYSFWILVSLVFINLFIAIIL